MRYKFKHIYIVSLAVIGLLVVVLSSSYALFTNGTDISSVGLSTDNSVTFNLGEVVEYKRISLNSGTNIHYVFNISNSTDSSLNFGLWYELLSPSDSTGVIIFHTYEGDGVVASGSSIAVDVYIYNTTDSVIILNVGCIGSSETVSVSEPRYLINYSDGPGLIAPTDFDSYLVSLANDSSITTYTDGTTTEMYTFSHDAGTQQSGWTTEQLTDYRYIGSTPNNYVYYNCIDPEDTSTCEVWRILGVFSVDDGTGNIEQRVKLISETSITATTDSEIQSTFSWDSSDSTINSGYGTNQWGPTTLANGTTAYAGADLMQLLNGIYYNRTSGTCYIGSSNSSVSCNFSESGLTDTAKSVISDVKFYTGGNVNNDAENMYVLERSETVYTDGSDVNRTTNWIGKIGLMYISDHFYSYGYGVDSVCFQNSINCRRYNQYGLSVSGSTYGYPRTSWIFEMHGSDENYPQGKLSYDLISMTSASNYAYHVDRVCNYGSLCLASGVVATPVNPVLYLDADVKVKSGNGTSDLPYELEYNVDGSSGGDTGDNGGSEETVLPILVDVSTFKSNIANTTTSVVFTDATAPTTATLTDVSEAGDGSVVSWVEDTTMYVSTQVSGRKVIASECELMFNGITNLTSIDFTMFDTSNVTDMSSMFNGCSGLTTLDLSNFDTSNVTDMASMFYGCSGLISLNLRDLSATKVNSMSSMFYNCSNLTTLDLSGFVTSSSLTNTSSMFYGCSKLTSLNLSGFVTTKVTNMQSMFNGCKGLTTLDLSGFVTTIVTTMAYMFEDCSGLTTLDLSGFVTSSSLTNTSYMFSGCSKLTSLNLSGFVTTKVTTMRSMFEDCSSLETINLNGFNTSSVTTMIDMFSGCSKLTSLNLSGLSAPKVTTMNSMFYNCSSLTTLNLSGFTTSSSLSNIKEMFYGCSKLTTLDLSGFNVSGVESMASMFYNCSSLTTLDLSGFTTSSALTDTSRMFTGCKGLTTLDLSGFNTENVTTMNYMFRDCWGLITLNVSSFNTQNVTSMYSMFESCVNLETIDLSGFNTTKVSEMSRMFVDCKKMVTTITIRKSSTTYTSMFYDAATADGAEIIVNYTADTLSTVNAMIATKSSSSNVNLGVQKS